MRQRNYASWMSENVLDSKEISNIAKNDKILFRNFIDEFQALHLPKAFRKVLSGNAIRL